MDFKLVKNVDRDTLEEWPTWGQYYEPADIDSLATCGYDRETVRAAIEAVGWSDDYWFPIPVGTPVGTFQFECRRSLFCTPDGTQIHGYVHNSGNSIGLFGRSDVWVINDSLLDLFHEESASIIMDLQLEPGVELLPLSYQNDALGGTRIFPLIQDGRLGT